MQDTYSTFTRGDLTPCNGIYVGQSDNGVHWVARATRLLTIDEAFAKLCVRFDQFQAEVIVKFTGVRSAEVLDVAEHLYDQDSCSGTEPERSKRAKRTKITATTITAPVGFFHDLADDLRDRADDWACGDRTVGEANCSVDLVPEFEEAANTRVARALRRWCDRFENA